MKYGNLNSLKLSCPLQACKGTALFICNFVIICVYLYNNINYSSDRLSVTWSQIIILLIIWQFLHSFDELLYMDFGILLIN